MPLEHSQHVNFHFEVSFNGIGKGHIDSRFQSVSGLEVQFETESIKEGGINQFEHVIPVRRKYSDLVLKRGYMSADDQSCLAEWLANAYDNNFVQPTNLDVILLNQEHEPLITWKVIHAWPKSWKLGELNAEKGEVLIETIELSYNYFNFQKPAKPKVENAS